jgi:single-strand DNA-binding protein
MKGLNKVSLIGHLGKAPDVRSIADSIKVARFSLATSEQHKDPKGKLQSTTDWHSVVAWRGLADLVEKYCRKGSLVYLEGKLKTRSFEDKAGQKRYATEVIAEQIILLDKKQAAPDA